MADSRTTRDAFAAIQRRIQENYGETPVAWPGRQFTPPDEDPWVKVDVVWGEPVIDSIEGPDGVLVEIRGVLFISVFARPGPGDAQIYELIDTLRPIVHLVKAEGVKYAAASNGDAITTDPFGWRQATVRTPFEYEEYVVT